MTFVLGLVVVIVCLFGSFVMMGGHLDVLWQPFEYMAGHLQLLRAVHKAGRDQPHGIVHMAGCLQ